MATSHLSIKMEPVSMELIKGIKEKTGEFRVWNFVFQDTRNGNTRSETLYNKVPNVFLNASAQQITGENTYNIGQNLYIALGSNSTSPTSGDTALLTETIRKASSDTSVSGSVAYITVFFASGEATGTHSEFGLFGSGAATLATASTNSGILYSRTVGSISVASYETLTITVEITFTSLT